MSHGKQFTLFTHKTAPNGWWVVRLSDLFSSDRSWFTVRKVAFVLEELGLTYESVYLDLQGGEHKQPAFTKHNPNGRIPAIVDHKNNDFTLWYVRIIS